jgi:hypothetical protein
MICRYAAERLRHRSAGNIGQLVAHGVLAEIAQLRFVEALAFQRDQADRADPDWHPS